MTTEILEDILADAGYITRAYTHTETQIGPLWMNVFPHSHIKDMEKRHWRARERERGSQKERNDKCTTWKQFQLCFVFFFFIGNRCSLTQAFYAIFMDRVAFFGVWTSPGNLNYFRFRFFLFAFLVFAKLPSVNENKIGNGLLIVIRNKYLSISNMSHLTENVNNETETILVRATNYLAS